MGKIYRFGHEFKTKNSIEKLEIIFLKILFLAASIVIVIKLRSVFFPQLVNVLLNIPNLLSSTL